MIFFLDSSALARRYVAEPGTARVQALFRRSAHLAVSRLALAEVASALTRAWRRGAINEDERQQALEQLDNDFGIFRVIEVRRRVVERARDLIVQLELRAYDAAQLASALEVKEAGGAIDFWCGDRALGNAARLLGMRTTVL